MNVREFFVAGLGLAAVLFGSAGVKADLIWHLFVRTRPVRRPRGFHHPGRNLMNPVMTTSVVKGRPAS